MNGKMTNIKTLILTLAVALLTLSACCCTADGIDPPQHNQYEDVVPDGGLGTVTH
jgi:hypothetical protein